jgi:hypothetical protein
MVLLKYIGGRTLAKEHYERKSFVFKKENNYECEVPEGLANFLVTTKTYVPISREIIKEVIKEIPNPLLCPVCGFKAKTETGLLIHSKKHKGD